MKLDDRVFFSIVLTTSVVIPGVADFVLSNAGYDTAGIVAWGVGYLSMAL